MSDPLQLAELVKQLQAKLEQSHAEAQAKLEQSQAEAQAKLEQSQAEAQAKLEQSQAEMKQLQAQLDQSQAQLEQSQDTTLEEYLRDYDALFQSLRRAKDSESATGHATKVKDKFYPMRLRRWDEFADIQQTNFNKINKALGDQRLFFPSRINAQMSLVGFPNALATENQAVLCGQVIAEAPVFTIFRCLSKIDSASFPELKFTNNNREYTNLRKSTSQAEDPERGQETRHRSQSGPNKRVASRQQAPQTYPDGLGFRQRQGENESLAFVYDYKAAHKLEVGDLKAALVKETLFTEVIQQIHNTTIDTEQNDRHKAEKRIAMALTQVFDYMVWRGVAYGYVTAGQSLVLLHIKQDDLRTLYYHHCVPGEVPADETGGVKASHTILAQLASFCLLSLQSEVLQAPALDESTSKAEEELKHWPHPYEEARQYIEIEDSSQEQEPESQESFGSIWEPESQESIESMWEEQESERLPVRSGRVTCRDTAVRRDDEDEDDDDDPSPRAPTRASGNTGARKRKEAPSSCSSADDHQEISSNSNSQPTKKYCTQACLLGLKRGWDLDEDCPNVSSHRTTASANRHPIDTSRFASLVEERLRQNPYQDCVAVDPYGVRGKIGAIGVLFKVELARYGYTFVGKGIQSAYFDCLQHETSVYSQLEKLQGEVVPVNLGIINLARGYLLPGGARVKHMMLMSWAGEVAISADVPDLAAEQRRSLQKVWNEGVVHGDEREPNILWNEERQRVMIIDFDRAILRPAPRHKQLTKVFKMTKPGKRKREKDGLETSGLKRARMGNGDDPLPSSLTG